MVHEPHGWCGAVILTLSFSPLTFTCTFDGVGKVITNIGYLSPSPSPLLTFRCPFDGAGKGVWGGRVDQCVRGGLGIIS